MQDFTKFLTTISLLIFTVNVFANDTNLSSGEDHDYLWEFDTFEHPTVEVSYGSPQFDLEGFSASFQQVGMGEIKLGYVEFDEGDDFLLKSDANYLLFSSLSGDLSLDDDESPGGINTYLVRFGLLNREGYGYRVGNMSLLPYTSNAPILSKVDTKDYTSPFPVDQTDPLLNFGEKFRFGTLTESGISMHISNLFALHAGYERSLVFPRTLVWKLIGSTIIEQAGLGLIDEFVSEITDSTPVAGPIMNFILRSSWSYAIYEFRRNDMNWPFATAEPLTVDAFKFGISLVF